MISRERKKFGLVSRRTIKSLDTCVSNTARLDVEGLPPTCRISFTRDFVEYVGKELARGVTPYNPAFIAVVLHDGVYEIHASYLSNVEYVLLWKTKDKPIWLPEGKSDDSHPPKPSRNLAAYRAHQQRKTDPS